MRQTNACGSMWKMSAIAAGTMLAASPALAGPSQEAVLRSISDNVSSSGNWVLALAVGLTLAGALTATLYYISRRYKDEAAPTKLNHPGRLFKDAARALRLKRAEVKKLKALAEQQKLSSPLVLLLCPSVLAKAIQEKASEE